MNKNEERTGLFSKFLHHGGAGILAAAVIVLMFLLCATWLKSLMFGILIACILLPLQRYYQDKLLCKMPGKRFYSRIKEKITGKILSPEEMEHQVKQQQIFQSSLFAMISFFAVMFLVIYLAFSFLIPQAVLAKNAVAEWGKNSQVVLKAEQYFLGDSEMKTSEKEDGTLGKIRKNLRELATENKSLLTSFAFDRGKDLVSMFYHILKWLGTFLLDIMLSVFFGFYFLQKIAGFELRGRKRRSRIGEWFVDQFYNSPWLPKVSRKTKWQAIRILTHIGGLLTRWVRGYFTVIFIETILYTLLFTAGGIPYSLLAGGVAGVTVLLPFIGPVASFCLTAGLCIAFCESGLILTLGIVCAIYILINGLLEQFFLYPVFIGGVSGLTTVETIIVVLIGGLVAGISGMIFAVPAAATIKYIIPVIYRATSGQPSHKLK